MERRNILVLTGLVLLMVLVLSAVWEFRLDEAVPHAFRAEGWGSVVKAVVLTAGALVFPIWAALRIARHAAKDQAALRESEERYRALVDLLPNAILVHRRGVIVYVNPTVVQLLAATEFNDLIGVKVMCLVHPDDQDRAARRLKALWAGESQLPLTEMKLVRMDGAVIDVAVSGVSTTYMGEPAQQTMVHDITERRRAGRLLRAAAEGLSGAVGETFFHVLVKHLVDSLEADFAFVGKLGADGKSIQTIAIHGRDGPLDNFESRMDSTPCVLAFEEGEAVFLDGVREQFPQDRLLIQLQAESYIGTPLIDSSGTPVGILAILRKTPIHGKNASVSQSLLHIFAVRASAEMERSRHEEEVQASEDLFRSLASSAANAIILADQEGRIIFWNAGATEIFGYQGQDVLGRPLTMLMPERHRSAYAEGIHHVTGDEERRGLGGSTEVVGLRRDGGEFPIELSLSTWISRGERYFTTIIRDIELRKKAEVAQHQAREEAEFADRAKTEFLANMSHELRTPLNSIIGFSDIVSNESFGPMGNEQYLQYAKDINESGKHLLDLINDLLDVARIETGETHLHEEMVDVAQTMAACHRLVKQRAYQGGVKLAVKCPPHLPLALVDPRQIKQILLNLLSNAVKFTDEGGSVDLSVSQGDDGGLVFVVKDTGIGIASKDISVALSTFGQADGSLARRYEGAGLGLPLSKRLIELHGGGLDLQSELGVGTTVTVWLPPERTVVVG